MSTQKFKRHLLATGEIDNSLHYGPFAIHWWYFFKSNNQETTFPIRHHMRIKYKINQQEFIVRVVKGTSDDEWVPGYICESDIEGKIYSTPTAVVNESYKKYSDTKTRFSGPDVLGFGDEAMIKQLQVGEHSGILFLIDIRNYHVTQFTHSFIIRKIQNNLIVK